MSRELDIVLFGATGFVGRLTAQHLAEHAGDDVRIGLAGRSRTRLEQVRASLPARCAQWPLVVVDAADEIAVGELAARAAVVCTTVGPYAKYGLPLVAACAAAGTHYCDLTGEVLFVRDAIDRHHDQAVSTGARIVTSCGFDSIPSDLGALVTADQVAADGAGTLGDTLLHVRRLRGGISGGTIDSAREQAKAMAADPDRRRIAASGHSLSPDRDAEPPARARPPAPKSPVGALAQRIPARVDPITGRWVAPFFMASHNTRIVRRSNSLSQWSYGRDFRYDEVMDTGRGVEGAVRAGLTSLALAAIFGGMSFGPTRRVLDQVLPKPGEGPSPAQMARGLFVMEIETTTTTGARYRTRVAAPYDPGYSGTAIMLGQSALCLARDDLSSPGGVLTPAVAMGQALVDRLRRFDFAFVPERL